MVERYDERKAAWLMDQMLGHYNRLALISTGQYKLERYRAFAKQAAQRFGLR